MNMEIVKSILQLGQVGIDLNDDNIRNILGMKTKSEILRLYESIYIKSEL